jgi:hypothetical protein
MTDAFAQYQIGLERTAVQLLNVTPSGADDLAKVSRAINVATSGTGRATTIAGTRTTAANIVALS